MEGLAINLALVAYNLRIDGRDSSQPIAIHDIVGTLARDVPPEPETCNTLSSTEAQPSTGNKLLPTEAEMNPDAENRGMWVGLWFPKSAEYTQVSLAAAHKQMKANEPEPSKTKRGKLKDSEDASSKGESVNTMISKGKIQVVDPTGDVRRVVVLLNNTNATYYALLPRRYELCNAYKVVTDEVFFFPEFRNDDLTSHQSRISKWPKLIRDARAKLTGQAPLQRKGPPESTSAPEAVPQRSFIAEFSGILQGNSALVRFAQGTEMLSEQEAKLAAEQLKELHPDIRDGLCDPEFIRDASSALVSAGSHIRHDEIRPFLALMSDYRSVGDNDGGEDAKSAIEMLKDMFGERHIETTRKSD